MGRHIFRFFTALLMGAIMISFTAYPVAAADVRSGQDVTVAAGETVNGDLYAAGNSVNILGTVNGDVFAAGRVVNVSGMVKGGLTVAAQNIDVSSSVGTGVRLAGQTISFSGAAGRDLFVAGSDANIKNGAKIGGDLISTSGTTRLDGAVTGNVRGSGGTVTINGPVGGNVDADVGNLNIAPGADIKGNLTYTSQNQATIEPGARIAGTRNQRTPQATEPTGGFPTFTVAMGMVGFLMSLLTGSILILLMENRIAVISDAIGYSVLGSLGWGALIFFVTPIVVVAVLITIIGIPIGIILLLVYGIALYLSQIFTGLFIGRILTGRYEKPSSRAGLIGQLALGLLIITVLQLIPFVGGLVTLAVLIFGLGAIIVAIRTPENQILSSY